MIRINDIRSDRELNIDGLKKKAARVLSVKPESIKELKILKHSLDARHKGSLLYIYSVALKADNEEKLLKKTRGNNVSHYEEKKYRLPSSEGGSKKHLSPVIAGFGPAGMFAALYLSCAGLDPIVIERGEDVDSRMKTVTDFFNTGKLNPESNVQFGEGGAGTFSDGKLTTGVKDKENRNGFVLESLVRYGAPESILTDFMPHIGSDILRTVVKNLRKDIIARGGEVRFSSKLSAIHTDNSGALKEIFINDKEVLPCENLILAVGHSARDTFSYLNSINMNMEQKSFAVGLRVSHLQKEIDRSMYGDTDKDLPPASYKLTYRAPDKRGVYSFCMCPGGYVINASSEENSLCVNGMSNRARDGKNANSAIVVTVDPSDFDALGFSGYGVLSGMEFQRDLEKKAFLEGNGLIPCQTLSDFKSNRPTERFYDITPECLGGFAPGNLRNVLPSFISEDIISAFPDFGRKIAGFDCPGAVLSGVESRTSSPVRILRDTSLNSSISGVYPAGEGAGYAGGIVSAAIDGLKCAEAVKVLLT